MDSEKQNIFNDISIVGHFNWFVTFHFSLTFFFSFTHVHNVYLHSQDSALAFGRIFPNNLDYSWMRTPGLHPQ